MGEAVGAGFIPQARESQWRGFKKGEYLFAHYPQGVVAGYGRLDGWVDKGQTIILTRPTRYALTSEGYVKRDGEETFHLDIGPNMAFKRSSAAEAAAIDRQRPWVEYHGRIVSTRNDGQPLCGVVRQVFDTTVTFNPYVQTDFHGFTPYRIVHEDLIASVEKLGTPGPFHRSLEDMVTMLNMQSLPKPPEGECPLQFQCRYVEQARSGYVGLPPDGVSIQKVA